MTGYPADISFDDGVTRTNNDGYYQNTNNTTSTNVSNSRGVGIVVGFAPGSVLAAARQFLADRRARVL